MEKNVSGYLLSQQNVWAQNISGKTYQQQKISVTKRIGPKIQQQNVSVTNLPVTKRISDKHIGTKRSSTKSINRADVLKIQI